MKVILKEEVEKLGHIGEVVNVAPGYARNYLFPKGYAIDATTRNIKALEHEKRIIERKAQKMREAARSEAERLSSVYVTISVKAGEEGKLFGSVTSKDIADAMAAEGHEIDRKKIKLDEPLKRLGQYTVPVKVYAEEVATITVNVVAENQGAEAQAAPEPPAAAAAEETAE